ncbi:MAG: alpha-ketoacid dehydrogenase subunit beta [Streptococcaceae bacterium]|jgi:pyruvate dehydrogenase E1 component beta subunit|nr:alpha-ketoacid dehydrogenase subunit beta [Streptococcaceae bacterium]
MPKKTYLDAVNLALTEILADNPQSFILGEDVGDYGGAFGATKGLLSRFPSQVLETPISEAAITGLAIGAALEGMLPILEIQFSDFLTVAMDQIVNQAAKICYLSNGQASVPLVIRAAIGSGTGASVQHSQSYESWFTQVPGLIVIEPSNAEDVYRALKAAVDNPNPVIIFEPKSLYKQQFSFDSLLPLTIGKSEIKRVGEDLTIIAIGRMVELALKAAESAPCDIEVVDPITLLPLDEAGILQSVNKTQRALVLTESVANGIASELVTLVALNTQANVKMLAGAFTPVPAAENLERQLTPEIAQIHATIEELMHG